MHIPRGSKKYPSGFEEIQGRVDRAIGRAIERALKRRREAPEPFRPKGRTPSGGWSWETYRRDVERVIKDSARRRGAPDPTRRRDTPVRSKREPIRHPFPPPVLGPQEAQEIEREVFEGIPPEPMAPLPRTAESRGFGDIKHSFPRPAPAPLPPMEPKIELPPVEVPRPAPIPAPSSSPSSSTSSPPGIPAAATAAMAALGVFVIQQANTRRSSQTRPRSQTVTPTSSPPVTETFTPPQTVAPTPTPTPAPSSPPSSPPPPTLTSSNATGASSRCPTPAEQRKQDKRKREQKRKECRQFLSVRVPAHKRKMCVSDLTKYLFRKLQRTARAALRKKIIAELEERGVPASRLIKATKRPRRKKAEVEVGGVEIDFEDLLGEK